MNVVHTSRTPTADNLGRPDIRSSRQVEPLPDVHVRSFALTLASWLSIGAGGWAAIWMLLRIASGYF